jgi:enoyl-CoA hydratase/carnithine racemase
MAQYLKQALAATKSLIFNSANLPLAEVYEEEKMLFTQMWLTEERLEAVRAIVEKRQPEFDHSKIEQRGFSDV